MFIIYPNSLSPKISYYEVSPNYEILMFATDVDQIVKMRDFKTNKEARNISKVFEDLDKFNYDSKYSDCMSYCVHWSTATKQGDPYRKQFYGIICKLHIYHTG